MRSGSLNGWAFELIILTKDQLVFQKEGRVTPDIRVKQIARETVMADQDKYFVSPNLDGNRRRTEWFGGSFTGK
ncbi:hypothetical protein [Jeotgalibacillus salarius]|uniref:hypothetical protein n=1 Tax=Jeotgalibacillus salarius TaxID=546023 RepID=UPI00141BB06C|nr:hypothetical protein [Jeotgalibacillus salarius]